MPRLKRKDMLAAIRVAGYHGDKERGILLYVKNRISLQVYRREFGEGAAMRQSGIPCNCSECRKSAQGAPMRPSGRQSMIRISGLRASRSA